MLIAWAKSFRYKGLKISILRDSCRKQMRMVMEYESPPCSCPLAAGMAAWGLRAAVCCGVEVRLDEQVMLPFQPASLHCVLSSEQCCLCVPLASTARWGRCAPMQVLLTAVQCREQEGRRAEPMVQVLSEQAKVEGSCDIPHIGIWRHCQGEV